MVGAVWLSNQLVGFLILDYPRTGESFAWGAAIGAGTLAAFLAALLVGRMKIHDLAAVGAGFVAAFAAYEAMLYAATFVLPSSDAAFSSDVVLRVLEVNAVSFGLLVLALHVAVRLRLASALRRPAEGVAG